MKLLRLQGDQYQMGQQHGTQVLALRPQILSALDSRLEELDRHAEWVEARQDELERAWAQMAPTTLEMLKGMAEGLAIPYSRLLRYAIAAYLEDVLGFKSGAEGCTVWAASGPATRDGLPILAKNRDYRLDHRPIQTLAYAVPSRGYRYLYVTSAGSPGVFSSGMNEKGLAIADTHVSSTDIGIGLTRYTLMMELLERHVTVDTAVNYLTNVPRMGSGNLILADARGDMAVFEVGYQHWGLVYPVENIVVATNHFVSPQLCPSYLDDHPQAGDGESQIRYEGMHAMLSKASGDLDIEKAMSLMAQHNDGQSAICRHDCADGSATISSVIFSPIQRRLFFSNGLPCMDSYETYSM